MNCRRALTRIDLLVAFAVIATLAAVYVVCAPRLCSPCVNSKVSLAQSAVDSGLDGAIAVFRTTTKRLPRSLTELTLDIPSDAAEARIWPGTLVADPVKLTDPWGHEFIYVCPGSVRTDSYDLSSPGPDGVAGNDDDIVNWKKQ